MLQRIQSLYLLITAILFALLFFMKIYTVQTASVPPQVATMNITTITVFQPENPEAMPPLFQPFSFMLNLVLLVLVIVTIFWYKNRLQQNLLTKLCILLNSGLIVLILFSTDKLKNLLTGTIGAASYQFGIVLPAISLVLLFLAGRSIMKDENLVRSADRLR